MREILVLNGSPRARAGNTEILVDAFLRGMKQSVEPVNIKRFYLKDLRIHGCAGCYSCWNRTPGKCTFDDDMTAILDEYAKADIIVFATPLYHYGMTALLKTAIERTLPLNKPYMVKNGERYSHPARYPRASQKHVLISNCGFPERHNFDAMVSQFDAIAGGKLDATILCAEGELLRIPEAKGVCAPYLANVEKAGEEFIAGGRVSDSTGISLEKNFIAIEAFVDMANASWKAPGEQPPSSQEAHGIGIFADAMSSVGDDPKNGAGMTMKPYIDGMLGSFNAAAAEGMRFILRMDFDDIGESYGLSVADGSCVLLDNGIPATTTIRVSSTLWRDIGSGKVDGVDSLMNGLYRIEGDFSIMMKFSEIFGSSDECTRAADKRAKKVTKGFLSSLSPMMWLSFVAFVPWYVLWLFGASFPDVSAIASFSLSLAMIAYRKRYLELTPFDVGNALAFAAMGLWLTFDRDSYIRNAGTASSIALAVIWGATLAMRTPLTAWYSKSAYSPKIAASALFRKINRLLTAVWVMVYLVQAVIRVAIPSEAGTLKSAIVYGLLFAAGYFTAVFPKKYLAAVASRKDKL